MTPPEPTPSSPYYVIISVSAILAILALIFKIGEWKGKIETDIGFLKSMMLEVQGKIEKIFGLISSPGTAGKSPLQLNEFGEKVASQLEVDTWINLHVETLERLTQDFSEYGIQERSFEYAESELLQKIDSELENKIENVAYNNGLNLSQTMRIVGVVLRDKILARRGMSPP